MVRSILLSVGGCGGGECWRPDHFWCRQHWRFRTAMAMIDERLNFNQNGARSIFREVNRLISQPLLPSSLPFLSYSFLSTWPLLTLAHHLSLSHQHLDLLLPYSTICPSFPPILLHFSSTSQGNRPPPPPSTAAYTIKNIPLSFEGELDHQSTQSAHLLSHSFIRHKTMR